MDPVHLTPDQIQLAHSELTKPHVKSLLSMIAMNAIIVNQQSSIASPEKVAYLNQGALVLLADIFDFNPHKETDNV